MQLLDIHELAAILKRSPDTIRKDLSRNPQAVPPRVCLPGTRLLRWHVEDVDAWLRQHVTPRTWTSMPRRGHGPLAAPACHVEGPSMNWTALDIAEALNAPRPVLDCVLPGLPVGTVGNLVAPGATGKTQFLIQLAVARCLGLPALGGLFPAAAPENVLLIVAEENPLIMCQRLHDVTAWLVEEGLFPTRRREDLIAQLQARLRLFPLSGQDVRLVKDGCYTDVLTTLAKLGQGCRLIIVDPLRRFHDGDENDSGAMTQLVQGFEHLAQQAGAAVLLAHHTNKAATLNGQGESQQAARGSSALTDGVRWQANLTGMSAKTATDLGLPVDDARFYVRFDISKTNYGAPQAPVWLRRLTQGVLTRSELPGARQSKAGKRAGREVAYD